MASLLGVNIDRTISLTFVIGAALAAVAGIMYLLYYGVVDFYIGFVAGVKAFTAAVLGGIGSLPGAMLGGLADRPHRDVLVGLFLDRIQGRRRLLDPDRGADLPADRHPRPARKSKKCETADATSVASTSLARSSHCSPMPEGCGARRAGGVRAVLSLLIGLRTDQAAAARCRSTDAVRRSSAMIVGAVFVGAFLRAMFRPRRRSRPKSRRPGWRDARIDRSPAASRAPALADLRAAGAGARSITTATSSISASWC